ncbi:MAG: DUF6265 family protein [Pseudomonadales bacterium]
MKITVATTVIFLVLVHTSLNGQDAVPDSAADEFVSEEPTASLTDVAWLQGHWQGRAFGGVTEEVWTPPFGGSMMGAFKLVADGEVKFYEFLTISEEGKTLMLKLKHFHGDLRGWEEKNETVDFPLVEVGKDKVFFDGFTFEKTSDDEMTVYVRMEDNEGRTRGQWFSYQRLDHMSPINHSAQTE